MHIQPEKIINENLYQVFLVSSPCSFPISFARHHWFVVNKKGTLSRWEVLFQKDCCGKSWSHLHLNAKDSFEPLGLFTVKGKSFWNPEIVKRIEGNTDSVAQKIIEFIENSPHAYPYCHTYLLWGPNSNTYAQWVLDHFPEFKTKLCWNAFGKKYK